MKLSILSFECLKKKFVSTFWIELENSSRFMSAKFIHSIKNVRMNWMSAFNAQHLLDSEFEQQHFLLF